MIRKGAPLYCFATVVRKMKAGALNQAMSDEEFVRDCLSPLVEECHIKNRNGAPFDLSKSRVSLLLSQAADVPGALRDAIRIVDAENKVLPGMQDFIDNTISPNKTPYLVESIMKLAEEDTDRLTAEEINDLRQCGNQPVVFFTHSLFLAIQASNQVKQSIPVWHRGNSHMDCICGDLLNFGFQNRSGRTNIVVIPVNTAFDVRISWQYEQEPNPLVSPNTIHGMWLNRWQQAGNKAEELDKRIKRSLKLHGFMPVKTASGGCGGCQQYPIGSISVIEEKNAVYYLLAISEFDEKNTAHTTPGALGKAVQSLLSFYDHHGQAAPIYLPLMGTGRSRAGLSYLESFALICDQIRDMKDNLHGSIHIVAQSDAFAEIQQAIAGGGGLT